MKGSKYVISIALLVAMLMCMWVMMWSWLPTGNNDKKVSADTLRVVVYDTIPYYKPVPKDSVVIRYITQKLPVGVPKLPKNVPNELDCLGNFGKSVPDDHFEDMGEKVTPDSVDVVVPITQKVYEDSTYTAYVSGYCARLDSLIMYPRHEEITVYRKPKRWHLSVSLGMGLVYDGRWRVGPGAMIGMSFDF